LLRKLKSKSVSSRNILKLFSPDRKVMLTKEEDTIEFEVGDYTYLKVSPMKGVQRFGVKRKLVPRYVGPYPIIEKSERVAYKIQLPLETRGYLQCFSCISIKEVLTCSRRKSRG
jgi:hypothetical protein